MFRAFSDPIRLRILSLVQPGELCVCDLVAILKLPQPTISRHLSYLRRAGLVKVRRDRSWNYYALTPARSAFHTKLLECLGTCFRDVPELAADPTRARAIRKKGRVLSCLIFCLMAVEGIPLCRFTTGRPQPYLSSLGSGADAGGHDSASFKLRHGASC